MRRPGIADPLEKITASLNNERIIVTLKGQAPKVLNIQLTSVDGQIFWANTRKKQKSPFQNGMMENSSVLITYQGSDQAMLQFQGNTYPLRCH